MKWYPLSNRECILLFAIFVIGYIVATVQRFFIPAEYRPAVYVLVVFILFIAFFFAAKPERPIDLAKFLSVLIGAIVFVIVVIEMVFGGRSFAPEGVVTIIGGAIVVPVLAGFIYRFIAKRRGRT